MTLVTHPASAPAEAQSPAGRAATWWRDTFADGAQRSTRAQLRRCREPADAVAIPAALSLAARLGRLPAADAPAWKQRGFERSLTLAVVLSHVEHDTGTPLLRALGYGQFPFRKQETEVADGRPRLSELRFRRFLQVEGEPELIAAFARLLRLADGRADVENLAHAVLRFEDDRTKRDLGLAYFRANDPDPIHD